MSRSRCLRQKMAAGIVDLVSLVCGRLLERHDLRVHVVRHGDGKKEEHEGEADGAPFLKPMAEVPAALMDPLSPPSAQEDHGDQQPYEIEE